MPEVQADKQCRAEDTKSTKSGAVWVPSIFLFKAGSAIRGIGDRFAANPISRTGAMRIPIATSPGPPLRPATLPINGMDRQKRWVSDRIRPYVVHQIRIPSPSAAFDFQSARLCKIEGQLTHWTLGLTTDLTQLATWPDVSGIS